MRYPIVLLFAYIGFVFAVNGQSAPCEAAHFFTSNVGCLAEGRGQKCIQLDITHSIDKEGKEFVYAWNFGDGTIQRGPLSEYCYEKFGSYQVTLDLLDPKTEVVIRNELATTINLLPKVEYHTDTLKDMTANFAYDKSLMAGITVGKVFWRIEDKFYCGKTARHSFATAGLHILEIGVVGLDAKGESFLGCTLMAVYIKPKP
jgi:PKD domain